MSMHTRNRQIISQTRGIDTVDGDGVKLTRIIGTNALNMLDPFLLLDYFSSKDALDYIGGFPTHPHRGFQTVTYLLHGQMRHKDSTGNEGVIRSGGVQWMSAGHGVLHSEMPEQVDGLMSGFQLWVNLPASAKMSAPVYQEFTPEQIPVENHADGMAIKVIAGKTNHSTAGVVVDVHTDPIYLDVSLPAGSAFAQNVSVGHHAFLYVIDGAVVLDSGLDDGTGDDLEGDLNSGASDALGSKNLAVLSDGNQVVVNAVGADARFLLVAGKPINEPVARGGPFVMNTKAEIEQAFDDYRHGRFEQAKDGRALDGSK